MSESNEESTNVDNASLEIEGETLSPDEAQAISEAEEAREAQSSLVKSLKLKIDGKEIDEELPFEIDSKHADYLKQQLQLAKVAQKRMQESAEFKKTKETLESQLKDFLIALKENPKEILSDPRLGVDVKAFAKKIIEEELAEEAKSPEEKEKERLQKERDEAIQKLQEQEKQRIESENRAIQEKYAMEIEQGILKSMDSQGLKQDARTLKRYSDALEAGLRYNIKLTPEEIGPLIKQQMYDEAKFYLDQIKDEEFENFVGKDRLSRVRKQLITNLRKSLPTKPKVADTGANVAESEDDIFAKKKTYKNSKSFFRDLRKTN